MRIKFDIKKLYSTLLFWIEKDMKIKERREEKKKKKRTGQRSHTITPLSTLTSKK
jgi:hypothetical protein